MQKHQEAEHEANELQLADIEGRRALAEKKVKSEEAKVTEKRARIWLVAKLLQQLVKDGARSKVGEW